MILWESDYRAVNGRTAFIVIVRTVNTTGQSKRMANEIYARIVHPLPRAAEKGEQDVFNTGNISHMHHGDSVDSPVTFISGNRGILPDAEKEVSR